MKAEYISHMGSDLTVVNAARVSFDKESNWDYQRYDEGGYGKLIDKDQKLITYLAKNNHWTPFSHVMVTMRETVPIFVARQRFKHMIGFTYNEVSRRYVNDEPEFFMPLTWRFKAEHKKQGSQGVHPNSQYWDKQVDTHNDNSLLLYNSMLDDGVAPEQARMILPQSMYTSYYVTGSLAAWGRAYKLRFEPDLEDEDKHAQQEIRELANQWDDIISGITELQHSWIALSCGPR